MTGRILVAGSARGKVLRLEDDISFWGAVDPERGYIIDRRHPQHGECVGGRVLLLRRSIGSSSGSAILLELLQRGCGPAAIILAEADQVLTLGAVVAAEMGYASIPVLLLPEAEMAELRGLVQIGEDGSVKCLAHAG